MGEVDSRMSSSELTEWAAYERMSGPLGRRRQDIQMADLMALTMNVNRAKGRKAIKASKILESWGCGVQYETKEQAIALIQALSDSEGGEFVGGPDS